MSRIRIIVEVALVSLLGSAVSSVAAADKVEESNPTIVAKFVQGHCFDCHSGKRPRAGLSLDKTPFKLDDPNNFLLWSRIVERIHKGEMPPKNYEKLTDDEKKKIVSSLTEALTSADLARQKMYGRSELRRLSRVEYANSLKDLLDLPHLELAEMLPPDGLAHGYPKSAKALDFSHVMVTRYLEVADHALWRALAQRAKSLPRETIRAELKSVEGVRKTLQTLFVQLKHTSAIPLVGTKIDPTLEVHPGNFKKRQPGYVKDPAPHFDGVATFLNSRSNHNIVLKPFKVKQSGYYILRVRGWGLLNDHGKLLPGDRTETVAFYAKSGRLLGRCDLPPNKPTTSEVKVWLNEDEPIEYLAISTTNEKFQIPAKLRPTWKRHKSYGIGLQWFEMDGPITEQWPPESHRRLLGNLKLEPTRRQANGWGYRVVTKKPIADARRLLRRFAERAYRRPVKDSDLLLPMKMVRPRLRRGEPFVDALFAGYRAILTSPEFLLLKEKPGRLDAWALASRLSYFLLNSPPDAELRKVAASGDLLQDKVLRRQTERMLNDPRSARFVEHFLDYWLDLRNIRLTEPDENLYPQHNGLLTESMEEETRAFFTEMLKSDLGASHVIDSDFLTINQRMAELYGIKNVQGSHIRKVPLPKDSERGGLLTQASLLKITANGTTTSPVVRGTFVLSRLLGDPPPPPPPSVPAIEPDISGATTIRQQLAKHRSVPLCASCHQKIDPPGFALESFDVMGAFRQRYRATLAPRKKGVNFVFNAKPARYKLGLKVDSAGTLPDGRKFTDIHDFRERLKTNESQIARNLLEQFIIYATGAPVGYADRSTVDAIMKELKKNRYGVRSMVHQVVQSPLFRNK